MLHLQTTLLSIISSHAFSLLILLTTTTNPAMPRRSKKHLSCIVRKPVFCIYAKKAQISCAADQCLCFQYIRVDIHVVQSLHFKPLAILCGCTAQFVSDLVGNPFFRDLVRLNTVMDKLTLVVCHKASSSLK